MQGASATAGRAHEVWARRNDEPQAAAQPAEPRRSRRGGSVIIAAFLVSLALPIVFYAGSVRLSPYRTFLILTFIPTLFAWLSGAAGRIRAADICILLFCVWAALAVGINHSIEFALEPSGIHLLETFGAYLLARVYIRDAASFQAMGRSLIYVIVAILPFALYQTLTSTPLALNLLGRFFRVLDTVNTESRLGLYRAQGTFEHPILFGVVCAMALPIAFFGVGLGKFKASNFARTGLVALAMFCSLSAGAFLAAAVQVVLVAWDVMTRKMPNRWMILFIIFALAFVVVDTLSNRSPFEVFISYFTFSTGASYNRVLIWVYGSQEVLNNPVFGIGFNDWTRPSWMGSSIDNFWLLTAMQYGVPGFALLVIGMLLAFRNAGRGVAGENAACQRAILIMLVSTCVAVTTVDLWNASYTLLMFLLGSGAWIVDSAKVANPVRTRGQVGSSRELLERQAFSEPGKQS